MADGFHWLSALCTSPHALHGGLLLGMFIAGAAGSVMHCGPMCGVFVLGQVSDRMSRLPAGRLCESHRIRGGLLLPYHLGRLLTYAMLGAGTAVLFSSAAWFVPLRAGLLVLAAVLFAVQAFQRVLPAPRILEQVPRGWGMALGRLTRRIPRGSAQGEFLLGLALGFLPCGFLYAALAAAAATASPGRGAAAMLAFGLGTAPSLMVVGVAGYSAGRRWDRAVVAAAPAVMALNAGLLLVLAWQG